MELQSIQSKIYEIRGQRVMLDFDLAELYQVPTKALKQAVRRNSERFPSDFMFEITESEYNALKTSLRSQIVTSNKGGVRYIRNSGETGPAGEGGCRECRGGQRSVGGYAERVGQYLPSYRSFVNTSAADKKPYRI